jgi:archaellum component FlaG (FlaF/FlaG flagellin family)
MMNRVILFKFYSAIFGVILLLASSGCESYPQDDYEELVVVEAYAIANSILPVVRVRTTTPADQFYDEAESAISGANVQLVLLDESGDDKEIFEYRFSTANGGLYLPVNHTHRVLPNRTYRLDIDFNDRSEVIRATTTIPDQFEIISDVGETVVYQSENQLEITISETKKREDQQVYVFSTIASDPVVENLTPFYRANYDNDNIEIDDVIINSSGLINEGNFDRNPDGTITLRFPWIGVAFYGENQIVTALVDKNLVQLVRSQEVQLGGSTLSPGEIPNLTYNIEGGIGIFGSISTDTVTTNFVRPQVTE